MWEEETRGRKQNFSSPAARPGEEEEETVSPQNGIISSFFLFFQTHETTSFCLKGAVSFK
jgi:hypothetical protein